MKWLVALGLEFTFEIITSKCIKLFIVHFFGRKISLKGIKVNKNDI
jgi:hypothetical protein